MNLLARIFIVSVITTSLTACANIDTQQEKGTAVGAGGGAALGAILGQVIGGDTEATLIGAGIGAVVGGLAGNQVGKYMDLQEQELRDALAEDETVNVTREEDILRATFESTAYFDSNSSTVMTGAHPQLARVSDVLVKYPHTTLVVEGHTDTRGDANYNQQLSESRANSVGNILVENGVSGQRITTAGYGEARPVSSDHALNRRVELVINPIIKQ